MHYFFHDIYGLIHLLASVAALIFGTLILRGKKGTKKHKFYGYWYVVSMVLVLVTAFTIYRVFNGFGLFHYAAIFAGLNLAIGMLAIWLKRPKENYLFLHLNFMYWSVISLYMAFAAEIATRIPGQPFFAMVYLASGTIMLFGFIGFYRKLKGWKQIAALTKQK